MSIKEPPSNYCDNEIRARANEEMVGSRSKHVRVEKSLIMRRFLKKQQAKDTGNLKNYLSMDQATADT
jgi:hypothetical protein